MQQAMLRLEAVTKDYRVADTTVRALKGVDLCFRRREFVSVLGPSGCGKTTLLNIIGGLDHYTSGDLVIKGVSTKNYKDADWDTYRNHSIGFVFQSYNLIPHQTVLGNVELALTLSGVSASERRERARRALERVGLGRELEKKPNQLSGGQMQRVAIARALVNNPEILLADEPTGALDTETSIQIMELIKEIAGERLVIMVTHNPELAKQYSTRIVRLLDGKVIDDTDPFGPAAGEGETAAGEGETAAQGGAFTQNAAGEENAAEDTPRRKKKKTSMSLWTAFCLSGRNLLTKKARTAVTAVAGSIGIISVCLVLALSSGFSGYISKTEEDMLSYYPVQITETAMDMTEVMNTFMNGGTELDMEEIGDKVYVNSFLSQLAQGMTTTNDLTAGNAYTGADGKPVSYLGYVEAMPEDLYFAIRYGYGVSLTNNLFTTVQVGSDVTSSNLGIPTEDVHLSLGMLREYYTQILTTAADEYSSLTQFVDFFTNVVGVMPGTSDFSDENFGSYVNSQYDVVAGHFPERAGEIVLVVGDENDATDLTLAQLGFIDEDDFLQLFLGSQDGTEETMSIPFYDVKDENGNVTQKGVVGRTFRLYYDDAVLSRPEGSSAFTYKGYERGGASEMAEGEGVELTISGVLRLKEGLTYGCLEEGLGLTEELISDYIAANKDAAVVQYLRGVENSSGAGMGTVNVGRYVSLFSYYYARGLLLACLDPDWQMPDGMEITREQLLLVLQAAGIASAEDVTEAKLDAAVQMLFAGQGENASYLYSLESPGEAESVIRALGGDDTPNAVSVYARDFDAKDEMLAYLDGWNAIVEGQRQAYFDANQTYEGYDGPTEITYTDTVGVLMGMVNTILNAITYVLVAFTGISLVVSTVMIGVITYVSVVERTKEIGILRSIGARKKDIKRVFNAETFIIGLCSGLFGVVVAYLLQGVINLILTPLTGIAGLAALPLLSAGIMVVISVLLTLISGLIPAAAAAKRDPVVALRSE